jgi:DNA-binding response OmpR family regulator
MKSLRLSGSGTVNAAIVTPFPRRPPLTLLVLDPDAAARCLVCDALRAAGFKVAEASTPEDAQAVLETLNVDLVLADRDSCTDPFLAWLQREHPGTRLLLASPKGRPGATEAGSLVPKPYAIAEVVERVEQSLHDPAASRP